MDTAFFKALRNPAWLIPPSVYRPFKQCQRKFRYATENVRKIYLTFLYNDHMSLSYALETVCEPLFWFFDRRLIDLLGPVCIAVLAAALPGIVVILVGEFMPWFIRFKGWPVTVLHFCVGFYICVSLAFHYAMGLFTPPGSPALHPKIEAKLMGSICPSWLVEKKKRTNEAGTIPTFDSNNDIAYNAFPTCRHCGRYRPPRTHHCAICRRCMLRMDHHCPWLNACVGYHNHRYFFSFMAYLVIGAVYMLVVIWPLFMAHVWAPSASAPAGRDDLIGLCHDFTGSSPNSTTCMQYTDATFLTLLFTNTTLMSRRLVYHYRLEATNGGVAYGELNRYCVFVSFILGIICACTLGPLTLWHAYLISTGQTSIELHINNDAERSRREILAKRMPKTTVSYADDKKAEEKRPACRSSYDNVNPYDFGWKLNWKIAMGLLPDGPHDEFDNLTTKRSFCRHVLLPSWHKPMGNGYEWRTKYDNNPQS